MPVCTCLRFLIYGIIFGMAGGCGASVTRTPLPAMLPEPAAFCAVIDHKPVRLFTLENKHGSKIAITNYGGRIVSWLVPDRNGVFDDIVLGYDSIEGYQKDARLAHLGALIGRVTDRTTGMVLPIDSEPGQFSQMENNESVSGRNSTFQHVVWDAEQPDENHLILRYNSVDARDGYPGNLDVHVEFTLSDDNALRVDLRAVSDQPTPFNPTFRPYFNLGGAGAGHISKHRLQILADHFMPASDDLIPDGTMTPVQDTPFDFREAAHIGDLLDTEYPQIQLTGGYDHTFVLANAPTDSLRSAAQVLDPHTGRLLRMYTTENTLHFYSGNSLDGFRGKAGKRYQEQSAFTLEPGRFSHAADNSGVTSIILQPGQQFTSSTVYQISINTR